MNAKKIWDTNGPSTFTQPIRSCPLQAIPPSVLHVCSPEVANPELNVGKDVVHAKFSVKAGKIDLHYVISEKVAKAAIPHDIHIHKKKYSRESLLGLQPGLSKAGRSGVSGLNADSGLVSIFKGTTFVVVELEDEDASRAVSTTSGVVIAELDEGSNQSFIGAYFYVRLADSEDGTLNLRTRIIKGLLEDPATKSAASTVTGYLSLKQGKPNQTLKFTVTQGVEMGRRSNIGVEVGMAETHCIGLVNLFGKAVQVMKVDLKPKWVCAENSSDEVESSRI